jgi:hypothetical protein
VQNGGSLDCLQQTPVLHLHYAARKSTLPCCKGGGTPAVSRSLRATDKVVVLPPSRSARASLPPPAVEWQGGGRWPAPFSSTKICSPRTPPSASSPARLRGPPVPLRLERREWEPDPSWATTDGTLSTPSSAPPSVLRTTTRDGTRPAGPGSGGEEA